MTVDPVLNGGNSVNLFGIGLDCEDDDIKAAVIEELGAIIKELTKMGKASVLNTLDTLAELIKPGSTTKPEAMTE